MFNGIRSLWEAVTNLPSLIANALSSAFDSVVNAVKSLGTFIIEGIKEIFIPDMEEMKVEFANLVNSLSPSGVAADGIFPSLDGVEPSDVDVDYDFGLFKLEGLKLVDYSFLKDGVVYFRPIINGFLIWLAGLYWYREFLSFIGQAPNMASSYNDMKEHQDKESKKGGKP